MAPIRLYLYSFKSTSNLTQVRAVHTLIVGVDIAKKTHWARMLDGRMGIEVDTALKFKNSTEGFGRLPGRMSRARERIGAENIVVAMEPGKAVFSIVIYPPGYGRNCVNIPRAGGSKKEN